MPKINEKNVDFVLKFPAKDNWDLPQALSELGTTAQGGGFDLQKAVPVLQRVVRSWEFDGDPKDADAFGDLDIFRELIPLVTAVARYIGELTGQGEAASEPTSQ